MFSNRKVKIFFKKIFQMGWYRPHATLNKHPESGTVDRCIFCNEHKPIKRSDFVLEFSEWERETGNICKDCYTSNSKTIYLD